MQKELVAYLDGEFVEKSKAKAYNGASSTSTAT